MTMIELLDSMNDCQLFQDGEDILCRGRDPTPEEIAAVGKHKQALLRTLPKAPADAPPKIEGPGGNVIESAAYSKPQGEDQAMTCIWCGANIEPAPTGRQTGDAKEYHCPDCGQRFTLKAHDPDHAYPFFPSDIDNAITEAP